MGYGESQPLEQGTSKAARARNRRVDFIILRPFSISANIGIVQSIPSGVDNASGGMGLLLGGLIHYAIADKVELQAGINFINRNVSTDDAAPSAGSGQSDWDSFGATDTSGLESSGPSISYLEVPVTAHYMLPVLAGQLYPFVGGGLSFGLPVGAKVGDTSVDSSGLLPSFVIEAGTTYETPFGLMRGQLRYSQALGSAVEASDDLKISTLDLQVGYVF